MRECLFMMRNDSLSCEDLFDQFECAKLLWIILIDQTEIVDTWFEIRTCKFQRVRKGRATRKFSTTDSLSELIIQVITDLQCYVLWLRQTIKATKAGIRKVCKEIILFLRFYVLRYNSIRKRPYSHKFCSPPFSLSLHLWSLQSRVPNHFSP